MSLSYSGKKGKSTKRRVHFVNGSEIEGVEDGVRGHIGHVVFFVFLLSALHLHL